MIYQLKIKALPDFIPDIKFLTLLINYKMEIKKFISILESFGDYIHNPLNRQSKANSITNNQFAANSNLPLSLYINNLFYSKEIDGFYYGFKNLKDRADFLNCRGNDKNQDFIMDKKRPIEIANLVADSKYAQVVPIFFNEINAKL